MKVNVMPTIGGNATVLFFFPERITISIESHFSAVFFFLIEFKKNTPQQTDENHYIRGDTNTLSLSPVPAVAVESIRQGDVSSMWG